jgi:hypothetical protein
LVALTLESLASLHETMAATPGHPLESSAGARAAEEREIAAAERRAAGWFRSLNRGTEPARGPD